MGIYFNWFKNLPRIIIKGLKKGKESEKILVLDIGTETIKSLVFQKRNKEFIVLGAFLEYFNGFEMFDVPVIKRAILKTFQNLKEETKKLSERVLLSPPSTIFKARVVFQYFIRKNSKEIIDKKEEKTIIQQVLKEVKEDISQKFSGKFGVLPEDIHFINLKILEIKIDGYKVLNLTGYKGEKLQFRVLTTFLSKYYLKYIENIIRTAGFKNTKIVHQVEGLISFLKLFPKIDGIFLDIGGEISQIFFVKEGILAKIDEFEMGGKNFSQVLSKRLGLTEERSRLLKERYSKKILSKESSERIKEIFWPEIQNWFFNLKKKISNQKILISKNIFLFGEGSQLAGIKKILKNDGFLPYYLKDIKIYHLPDTILLNPQFFSSFLICYTA